jgi:hypothetical protein
MKPTIPPPVPYCVALELRVVKSSAIGAAEQRAARQRWRKSENMIVVVVVVVVVDCWLIAWGWGLLVARVLRYLVCSRLLVLCNVGVYRRQQLKRRQGSIHNESKDFPRHRHATHVQLELGCKPALFDLV